VFGARHLNHLVFSRAMPAARLILRQLTFASLAGDKRLWPIISARPALRHLTAALFELLAWISVWSASSDNIVKPTDASFTRMIAGGLKRDGNLTDLLWNS
jgi:hypothetical protein